VNDLKAPHQLMKTPKSLTITQMANAEIHGTELKITLKDSELLDFSQQRGSLFSLEFCRFQKEFDRVAHPLYRVSGPGTLDEEIA